MSDDQPKKTRNRKRDTRRPDGEGSWCQRPNGTWEGRFTDAVGKQHSVYGKTKAVVVEKIRDLREQEADGRDLRERHVTVAEYLERWLDEVAAVKVKPRTLDTYRGTVETHLIPTLGKYNLDKLTPERVQALINQKTRDGLSPRTVQIIRATLRNALNQAVRWRLVPHNVADVTTPPRQVQSEVSPLSVDETRWMLTLCRDHPLGPIFALAATTGLRQGEILGLQWKDVDLVGRRLSVRQTLMYRPGHGFSLETPKTEDSRRGVPLTDIGVAALRRQHKIHPPRTNASDPWRDLVFVTDQGEPLSRFKVSSAYERLLRDNRLPVRRFHDLRHGAASILVEEGIEMKVIQEILGHSQITMTSNTYAHVSPRLAHAAAAALDRALLSVETPVKKRVSGSIRVRIRVRP